MVLTAIPVKPKVDVPNGMIEHHAGRNALLPVVITVLLRPFRTCFGQAAKADGRNEIKPYVFGIGAATAPVEKRVSSS